MTVEWKHYKGNPRLLPSIWKNMPQPSLEERDRRWGKIREKMSEQGLDCLLVFGSDMMMGLAHANFRYVTAIHVIGQCVALFPLKGDPIAYISTPHNHYYKAAYRWVGDVRPSASDDHVVAADDLIREIKERGYEQGRIGIPAALSCAGGSNDSLQYYQWLDIKKGLPKVEFIEGNRILDELKLIKSAEEIRCMEEAGKISTFAYQALIKTAKPGVKECEIYANMKQAIIANSGDPSTMLLMDSGNPALGHPKDPPPTSRKLEQGDMIIVEYHTGYAGYSTGTQFSVSLGEPTQERKDLFEVLKRAYSAALEQIRPGGSFKEATRLARDEVYKSGMDWMECGTHLHGLGSGEWRGNNLAVGSHVTDNALTSQVDTPIQAGMCVGFSQTFFNPKLPDAGSLMLAFTHLVTKDGQRQLESIPWELTVV
jgi:Xaa-Pro aminopeptidase